MRHLDLFSGIGGFALAARWIGWQTVQFVEIDKFCQQVLQKNFPGVPIHEDIKTFDGTKLRGAVDILTGGPPCQPASIAGKRKGEADNRWLWPEAIRIFTEVRPRFAVFENPDDLLTLEMGNPFERICSEMENIGYKVEPVGIPAACVGAWHERDRVWIIAYLNNQGELQSKGSQQNKRRRTDNSYKKVTADPYTQGLQEPACTELDSISTEDEEFSGGALNGGATTQWLQWPAEPCLGGMVSRVPNRVDRIKALGNSVVPQVVYQIFKAIEELNNLPPY